MKSAVTRTWYRIALGRPEQSPVLVAAQGEHLGAAISVARREYRDAYAMAAEVASGQEIPLGESVGKHPVVELGTAEHVTAFRWPAGVLPQLNHEAAIAGARPGWIRHDDPQALVIEAQTDAAHLVDLFMGLIERLPSADNLEVRVLDHFEPGGVTDVWLTSRVNAKKILAFLDDYEHELIDNGHLELSVYVRAEHATLRLTEHKTVVWIAETGALEQQIVTWLGELEVPRVDALARIVDVPHFHFRPGATRDRKKLGEELYRQRLRRVATIPAEEPQR
ncbi:MAG: hypothetical protein AB7O24_08455 [Kofleriaceae bacterium]